LWSLLIPLLSLILHNVDRRVAAILCAIHTGFLLLRRTSHSVSFENKLGDLLHKWYHLKGIKAWA
ncbi:hypothetical protein ACJX0J_042477, partial [Zea mays]